MDKKNMGRKFKVGDKVVLTELGEQSKSFTNGYKKGDKAIVIGVDSTGAIRKIDIISGEAKNSIHYSLTRNEEGWFKLVEKKSKKKRKYFRMGDFVALKDGVITDGNIGVVCGIGDSGYLEVHFGESPYDFDRVPTEALRLATKEERKALRKHKVAKITYDDLVPEEVEEGVESKCTPPEYDVKVGDIVEVTLDVYGHPVGTIGEVTFVQEDTNGHYNRVKLRNNNGDLWNERNVKLVYRKPEKDAK